MDASLTLEKLFSRSWFYDIAWFSIYANIFRIILEALVLEDLFGRSRIPLIA